MAVYHIGKDFTDPIEIEEKHASVSRRHARLTVDGDNWILEDTESTNGTYVQENGEFRRCARKRVTPDTWIRLGEHGYRGYYFKARRVLKPHDYREDFAELYEKHQQLEGIKKILEQRKNLLKYVLPLVVNGLGWGLSYLPIFNNIDSGYLGIRLAFFVASLFSPILQDLILKKLEKKTKELQVEMICPKCRKELRKDDILSMEHSLCKAR